MPGMDLSDNELAALAGKGDAEAYRRLFERYQHPVYNFVYRLVDNAEDASDIVQDAFIKMYSVLGARDIQNFSAYLYRTAKNLAYDEMRRRTRFADVDHEMLAPEDPNIYADPQRALLLGEQMETVRRAARGLNENQRAALILRELGELDYDQMSEVLESNRNAVGALLSRARLKFREELRMAQISTEQCPPDCEEIIAMLSPYIDGELKDDQKERVESHLEGCTFCLAALEEMREASRSFRMFIPVIPPAAMAQAFTGRLAELAGQGTGYETGQGSADQGETDAARGDGGRDEVTRLQTQAGGGSKFSRLLHRKAVWIGIATVALLVPAVALLADVTGGGDAETPAMTADSTRATTATAPMQARTQTQTRKQNEDTATTQPSDTTSSTDTATVPAGADGSSNSSDAGQTQSPGGGAAPMSVRSGQASPNPVYEKNPVAYTAVISGVASTVTVDLSPRSGGADITVPLSRQSAGSGTETWAATGTAPGYGTYYIYIYATNTQGQTDSLYVGILTVNAMIY